MKQIMRHLWTKTGWLVMAAALMVGMASCAADDSITEQQQPQQETAVGKTLHVTVSAGIADDATTRSAVDYNTTTKQRTLQFTVGDRLYVRGGVGLIQNDGYSDYYNHIIAGYLDIDASTINGSTATFSGDLTVYEVNQEEQYDFSWDEETGEEYRELIWIEYSYPDAYAVADVTGLFTNPANPLPECDDVTAVLVHEDATNTSFYVNRMRDLYFGLDLAPDVNTLMTTILYVTGSYSDSNGSFTLTTESPSPILNCTVTGLTANTTYKVSYSYTAGPQPDFKLNYSSTTTADGTGKATFALLGDGVYYYHALRLANTSDANDVMLVDIGPKNLETKVYNVTRAATEMPFYVISRQTESYLEMVNGTYTLDEGYRYYIQNSGRGNIESITTESHKHTVLELYGGPILKGKVHLEASGDGNATISLYSGNATISNPGQVALQAGNSKTTSVNTNNYVLTVDGDISGKFRLTPGSTLRVSGSVGNDYIQDSDGNPVTPVEENGYKVYCYNPIDVYAYAQGTYTATFDHDPSTSTTLIDMNETKEDYQENTFYKYRLNVPYRAIKYTINNEWSNEWSIMEVGEGDIVIDGVGSWYYYYEYEWEDPQPVEE
jgi:hypothetical protein